MDKILTINQAIKRSKEIQSSGKSIVLGGGCFDLIHIGHITFLEKAKEHADILFLLLEADEKVQKAKGKERPINPQKNRARVLAAIAVVDYVVLLPPLITDKEYDHVLLTLKPAIIATIAGDPYRNHKERQAALIGAKVVDVVLPIQDQSTSRILKILSTNL